MKCNLGGMKQWFMGVAAAGLAAVSDSVFAATDIAGMFGSGTTIVNAAAKFLNGAVALGGGYMIVVGVMNWKKSSNEHGGHQVEFKSIVVPIAAGTILVCFSAFLTVTSTSFGFASPNTSQFN